MYYLDKIGFNRDLLNAMYLIVTSAPNENIGFHLDSVTDEQVARANIKVYKEYMKK